MRKIDANTLRFIMEWMDTHVDERGVRQPPGVYLLRTMNLNANNLLSKSYLTYRARQMIPTAKAEVWWIMEKRRMRGER